MANINNLNIHINSAQAAQAVTTTQIANFGTNEGFMLFDEKTHLLWVHNQPYGMSDTQATQLTNVLETLVTNGLFTKEGDVYTPVAGDTIGNLETAVQGVQDKIGSLAIPTDSENPTQYQTVTEALNALQSLVNTLSGGALTDVTVNGVQASIETTGDKHTAVVDLTGENIPTTQGANTVAQDIASHAQSIADLYTLQSSLHYAQNITYTKGVQSQLVSTDVNAAIDELSQQISSIDKDSFVQSGSLVYGPATGIEGRKNARPDSVEDTQSETATDPYLELVIKQYDAATDTTAEAFIYIKADSLVNDYNGSEGVINVSIDNNHNITATLENGALTSQGATGAAVSGSGYNQTVQAANTVTVFTQDGAVQSVTADFVNADAAGAAQAAYDAALGTSGDSAAQNTIYGAKAFATQAAQDAAQDAAQAAQAAQDAMTAAQDAMTAAQDAMTAAQAAATSHTEVFGGSGATGTTNYVIVDTAQGADGHSQYTVKTTLALEEAISQTAQTAAQAAAQSVISWEVIGETGA